MKTVNIGNFKLGIDMKSDESELPRGAVRDAVNVDLTLGGGARRRRGLTKLAGFTGGHSLWAPLSQAFALFAQADALRMIVASPAGEISARTVMTGLFASGAMSYCELEQRVVFTNGRDIGTVDETYSARLLGVTDPGGAPAVSVGPGGLQAGRYGAAYSFINERGEESGLSPAAFIELAEAGGIVFTLPFPADDVASIRIYTTPANGEVLYQMAEVPAGALTAVVGDDTPGKVATTQHMHRMPGGEIARVFKGRLLIARANIVVFSEPFNYGLTSRRHNFVQFASDVTMIEPVEDGVYVGTRDAVYFLAGSNPRDFVQAVVSSNAPVRGTSTTLSSARLPDDMATKATDAPNAVWLGRDGYSIGMATGIVHDVQGDRITLPDYEAGSVVSYTKNGLTQLISVVQSEQSNGAGSAIDTLT